MHPRKHPADAFCPVPADALFGGGRFDSTSSDAYPFLYAGLTAETALCETLLRDLKFRGTSRQVLRAHVRGRVLSCLTTTTPLTMLSLASAVDLACICQPDDWLLRADGHEYAQTRAWAHWLRTRARTVHGLIWRAYDGEACHQLGRRRRRRLPQQPTRSISREHRPAPARRRDPGPASVTGAIPRKRLLSDLVATWRCRNRQTTILDR